MIRQAYFEDGAYVPLVLRSYEFGGRSSGKSTQDLLRIIGGVSVGDEESEIITGTRRSAAQHDLALETWSRKQ